MKKNAKKKKEFFVIAHNIHSLYNVGSIFRTADAFSVSKIFLTGFTGAPDNYVHSGKIGKVALGAENFVPWEKSPTAFAVIRKLKKDYPKIQIIALETREKAALLPNFKPKFPMALILGEERKGIEAKLLKLCDKVVKIPMYGQKESLNVSVAFGIAAYGIKMKQE